MSPEPRKILFVCSRNRRRSLTAEQVFAKMPGWQVRSAGTAEGARIKVNEGHLGWADVIIAMEKRHKEILRERFAELLGDRPCICLFISDDYAFMDDELIRMFREKMRDHFPELG